MKQIFKANGLTLLVTMGLGAALGGRALATPFTPGDLVVTGYSSVGGNIARGAETQISLIEYPTAGGAAALTDLLPFSNGVGGSGNLGIVGQYGSNSEGILQLSGDGRYLTLAGYSAAAANSGINALTNTDNGTSFPIGTAFSSATVALAQSADSNVPRLAITVDGNGVLNSTTVLNDVYNTNNPRSVYSSDGSKFYISGQGDGTSSNQGIFYGTVGMNTVTTPGTPPTPIYNAVQTREVTAFNSNLYESADSSSGSFTGIWKFSGTPTGAATPTQIIPANNGLSGSSKVFFSPDGFFFANSTTLYVADTGAPKAGAKSDGGIQKWTFNGSTWSLQYTLTPTGGTWVPVGNPGSLSAGQSGFAGITGQVVGSGPSATVDLYAVSYTLGDDDPNGLYSIVDTLTAVSGAGESFSEIESAAGNGALNFKGVSFAPVPEPTSLTLLCVAGVGMLGRRRKRV